MKIQETLTEKVVVKLTPSIKRQITIAAKKENVTISVFVRSLIESKIQKPKR
jgi:predicted HicB family RNase H-like nuclease